MKVYGSRSIYGVALIAALAGIGRAAQPILAPEIPERVAEYTSRVYQCLDWGRELNSGTADPARAAIITRAIEALDCKNLQLETAYLQKHYHDHSPAAEAVEVATLDWQNSLRAEKTITP
jgi:hypothetical protein